MPFRTGIVQAQDLVNGKVRVIFPDYDQMVSWWLFVCVPKTQNDKAYWIPDIGEQVLCFMDEHDEDGAVLGAIYSQVDTTPVQSADKWHVTMNDGGQVEYDRQNSLFRIDVPSPSGTTTVQVGQPPDWQANTQYWVDDMVVDANGNTQQCVTGGLSGSGEPDWSTTLGVQTNDGTAVLWTLIALNNGPVLINVNGATIQIDGTGNVNISSQQDVNITAQNEVNVTGVHGVRFYSGARDEFNNITVSASMTFQATNQIDAVAQNAVSFESVASDVVMTSDANDIQLQTDNYSTSVDAILNAYDAHLHTGVTSGQSDTGTTTIPI